MSCHSGLNRAKEHNFLPKMRLAAILRTTSTRSCSWLLQTNTNARWLASTASTNVYPSSSRASNKRGHRQSTSNSNAKLLQRDRQHTIQMVKSHDPAGYLPGQFLSDQEMKDAYYAVRSFWVETGLRFGTTALVPPHSSPAMHLDWWQQGIQSLYDDDENSETRPTATEVHGTSAAAHPSYDHPTLRLLQDLIRRHTWSKSYFDDILLGRRKDLDMKQYTTLHDLTEHARLSCGSLFSLVLQSGAVTQTSNPPAHDAARLLGQAHGMTNALRLSIPIVSTTGKLIIPQDLCVKYGVKSPRYLLSALGQGDAECKQALQSAVREIATMAEDNLEQARALRDDILTKHTGGTAAVKVFLPAVASDMFLKQLAAKGYDLTDKNLRHVGMIEQGMGMAKVLAAFYQQRY
jgi:phytoene/squalene synthetase